MNDTLQYYNDNAKQFCETTFIVEMRSLYQQFLQYLPLGSSILDIGCGSGRDTLYFHQQGYQVFAIDYSPEIVALARKNTNLPIKLQSFYNLTDHEKYDGIWACASLLHCERARLPEVLSNIIHALKPSGICYLSFKYGNQNRLKEGRSFTDLNEIQASELLKLFPNIYLLQQWITQDQRPNSKEQWLNIIFKKHSSKAQTPSAEIQMQFIANIQQLLATAKTTSTYKFALLISLVRISIEKNNFTNDETLNIPLTTIAEKFIEIYWQQARPYFTNHAQHPNSDTPEIISQQILKQNNGRQAVVITRILEAQKLYASLTNFKKSGDPWNKLLKSVGDTIHQYPLKHLQINDKTPQEFLYHYDHSNKKDITLRPNIAFCLSRFSIFIEEICQKYWMDNIRDLSDNQRQFGDFPNLDDFLFNTDRNHLSQIKPFLHAIQQGYCFYCGQKISLAQSEVDHFIPWTLYQYDTAHNFVLADKTCNNQKSSNLATQHFYEKWLMRNAEFDLKISDEIGKHGFLVDRQRSEAIAKNYYLQALTYHGEEGFWSPKTQEDNPYYPQNH